MGFVSSTILAAVYFQYFGATLSFLLTVTDKTEIFFMICSITALILSSMSFRVAFMCFFERYAAEGMQAAGICNKRSLFVIVSMSLIVLLNIFATIWIRYQSYALFLLGLYCFPLVNILENTLTGVRRCFSW